MTQDTLVISITFCFCNVLFYCILGKDNFRFGLLKTACLIALLFAVGKTIELYGVSHNVISFLVLCLLNVLPFTLYQKRNLISYSIYYCWNNIYNYIGTIVLGVIYPLISTFSENMGWYVRSEGSTKMIAEECLWMLFASVVAWLITRKLEPIIYELKGVTEKLFIILVPVISIISLLLKDLLINAITYRDDPQGIGFIIDSIDILAFNAAMVLLIIDKIRKRNAERNKVDFQLQNQCDHYQMEAEKLQEEYREWRHDQRNLQIPSRYYERNEEDG